MDPILKECAEMIIEMLAINLEEKLDDVIKENLPRWNLLTQKEKKEILGSIARYWLKQEKLSTTN